MLEDSPPSPKRIKLDTVIMELPTDLQVKPSEAAAIITAQVDAVELESERWIHLQFTWSGKPFTLDVAESDRVYDLKATLLSLTDVPPERQKILGLVKGKLPPDEERIGDLKLVNGKKFTLVGTPQGHELKDPSQLEFLPDVVNDLDVDFSANPAAARAYMNDQRNLRKVREYSKKLQVNVIHPLREGKRLLVLDIDYTILDTKPLTSESIYPYYDICIWSQTSWIWLEAKLVELGIVGGGRNYEISFVLDKTNMFTVFSLREGKQFKHSVKPLQIIWDHFPQFSAKNTVHVDDLGRNFALNPGQGLKIAAFKDAHTPQAMRDRELDRLARYLVHIAGTHGDFCNVNHKYWKDVARSLPH
ncbi:Ubiquitin-like domain-containing CTD phosphatase 1 [Grifola frondosa]|uniref:Ubiquitin-like domain-containing CTD phosphatase 1 n=1 Tax=Grifola frondosa TaxID=5627 RepID=A0A1C7LX34_GRIFR|nr:Ubiquitin-like domain-containing CTD phosphatase 1 [Grifola frondosa]